MITDEINCVQSSKLTKKTANRVKSVHLLLMTNVTQEVKSEDDSDPDELH